MGCGHGLLPLILCNQIPEIQNVVGIDHDLKKIAIAKKYGSPKIHFSNKTPIFQNQLNNLRQQGHTIFHIAEPLITIIKEDIV